MSSRPSLRIQLLADLGLVMSSAVLVVGLATALVAGADLSALAAPLILLWLGSTATFILFGAYALRRLVLRPLERLADEADALAAGDFTEAEQYAAPELDQLADRYRAMAAELLGAQSHVVRVEKLASVGQLAAGVAHEVRNPLGALGNYIEVLHRRGTDPAVTREMRCALERIERIVQGLVDYARPGAVAPAGATSSTDLNAAVRTATDFLIAQGMLAEHRVSLQLALSAPPVRGDRHALEQVVLNLVVNACQAAPDGHVTVGTIVRAFQPPSVETPRLGERTDAPAAISLRHLAPRPRRSDIAPGTPGLLLYVADQGPGVPPADRERIFDPFYTTKAPGDGTGLGLAIVARTVDDAGGLVWVDPAREGGAVFKVFLPFARITDAPADR